VESNSEKIGYFYQETDKWNLYLLVIVVEKCQ
jgi:hypothetical protein